MKASNKHKEQTIASEQYCPTLSEEYQELFRRLTKRLKDTLPMNRARIIGDELRRASEAAEENDLECKKYMAALSVLVDLSLAQLQEALSKDSDDLTKLIKPILAAPSEQEKRSINGIQYPEDNFASATNPGGGVTRGAGAQEECLCRCSTLYPNLDCVEMWDGFYKPHRRAGDALHNDDCIYTPSVIVFKTDTYKPVLMREENWYTVDVLTCAAPNLREKPSNAYNPSDSKEHVPISQDELQKLHEKRFRRICDLACEKDSDVLILGAFGCGAFMNPSEVVAAAARTVVKEYLHCFRVIEFAVYTRRGDTGNYDAFQRTLSIIR